MKPSFFESLVGRRGTPMHKEVGNSDAEGAGGIRCRRRWGTPMQKEYKLLWREAGPLNVLDDDVDPGQ